MSLRGYPATSADQRLSARLPWRFSCSPSTPTPSDTLEPTSSIPPNCSHSCPPSLPPKLNDRWEKLDQRRPSSRKPSPLKWARCPPFTSGPQRRASWGHVCVNSDEEGGASSWLQWPQRNERGKRGRGDGGGERV